MMTASVDPIPQLLFIPKISKMISGASIDPSRQIKLVLPRMAGMPKALRLSIKIKIAELNSAGAAVAV